jgi:hypothetical protein
MDGRDQRLIEDQVCLGAPDLRPGREMVDGAALMPVAGAVVRG